MVFNNTIQGMDHRMDMLLMLRKMERKEHILTGQDRTRTRYSRMIRYQNQTVA